MGTRPLPIFLVIFSSTAAFFFSFSRISQPVKKRWKFREQISSVREQPSPGTFPCHFLPFRFTPCHLFIPCLVSHYFSRCISKCSVLDDPRNRFIGLYIYIYIAFRVASFGRRDLLRKSFVKEKSWRKYKSEYIKHRLG